MDLLDTHIHSLIGEDGFTRLVAAFYSRIPADPILGPMYEKRDLAGARRGCVISLFKDSAGRTRILNSVAIRAFACATGRFMSIKAPAIDGSI